MEIGFSTSILKELKQIKKKDYKLAQKIEKKLLLLKENPKHPSLRNHKLIGKITNVWSISITMSIRMLYQLQEDGNVYFTDIGTHEEVYER